MNFDLLNEAVDRAIKSLLLNDSFLLEIDVHERSISHKLAEYLQREFSGWNVDCEYDRNMENVKKRLQRIIPFRDSEKSQGDVYPDIIIHHRGTKDNLLVMEIKTSTNRTSKEFDCHKLRAFKDELGYQFALFVRFRTGTSESSVEEFEYI